MNDAFYVVDLIAIDRQPRMFGFNDQVACLAHGCLFGKGHNLSPRGHHLADARVAKFYNRVDQLAFFFFQDSFRFTHVD